MSDARLIYILVLVAVLVFLTLFRRVLPAILLKLGFTTFLKAVGTTAVSAQPDTIALTKLPAARWRNPADIEKLVRPLLNAGFTDAGVYSIAQMPGVLVQFLIKSGDNVVAQVHEHPRAGSWVEFITRFQDGTCCVLSTMRDTGLKRPDWITTIRPAALQPTDELYRRLVMERKNAFTKAITADTAPREYEAGYARYMAWRKGTEITAEEVVKADRFASRAGK
jgi:hypothetical protein